MNALKMCAWSFERPETQTVWVWSNERFTWEDASREHGRPQGASTPSCSLDQVQGFWVGEGPGMRKRWWASFNCRNLELGPVWKGASVVDLVAHGTLQKVFWCLTSSFWYWVGWGKGQETLVPGAAGGQCSLCACFGSVTCSFDLLSLKSNSVSC